MIRTSREIKPARLIAAERALDAIGQESFEAWKARQVASAPVIHVVAAQPTPKVQPQTLGETRIPARSDVFEPRVPVRHGLTVRRERISEREWKRSEQPLNLKRHPLPQPIRGFKGGSCDVDWVESRTWDDSKLIELPAEEGRKPLKVFIPRSQAVKRARLNAPSKKQVDADIFNGISVRSRESKESRATWCKLCDDNIWRPLASFAPVVPENPYEVEKRRERIAAMVAREAPGSAPTAVPTLSEMGWVRNSILPAILAGQAILASRRSGPIRPPLAG